MPDGGIYHDSNNDNNRIRYICIIWSSPCDTIQLSCFRSILLFIYDYICYIHGMAGE